MSYTKFKREIENIINTLQVRFVSVLQTHHSNVLFKIYTVCHIVTRNISARWRWNDTECILGRSKVTKRAHFEPIFKTLPTMRCTVLFFPSNFDYYNHFYSISKIARNTTITQ